MATWPSTLPTIVVNGYSITPQQPFIRTEMDQGPSRQRRRFTTTPTTYEVNWFMTEDEFGIFESWYRDEIDNGAAWFNVDLRNGKGMQSVEARFMTTWKAEFISPHYYNLSSQLEVRNRPIDTRVF